jgi:hypothetical protein
MVEKHPFSSTPQERRELRQCAKLLFWGSNPAYQDETKEIFKKWTIFFDVFLWCRDARYGNLLHLPFSGGAFEQPAKTMSILTYIQSIYLEKLDYENRRSVQGIKKAPKPSSARRGIRKR